VLGILAQTIVAKYRCADAVVAGAKAGGCGGGNAATPAGAPPESPELRTAAAGVEAPRAEGRWTERLRRTPPNIDLGPPAKRDRIARAIMKRTRAATDADVKYVYNELRALPLRMLEPIEKAGVKVVVARATVSEHYEFLKGMRVEHPTEPDATYDTHVAGLYHPGERVIVIATDIARKEGTAVAHEAANV
jgi:hypothetical protein